MNNNLSFATNALKSLETSSSIGMFARDTGGCLISKLALSRTKEEAKETVFAESAESAIFYFSAPTLAKISSDVFSKMQGITKEELALPFSELKNIKNKESLKSIKLAKTARIASVFSLVLPLVFAIAPLRNLMTQSQSGKKEFSSVVGLKKENNKEEKEEAKKKAKNLTKTLCLTSLCALGATMGLLAASKNNKIYKKIEPALDKTIKHLDFTKSGDLELSHYGALIYPVSIASYFYASRDKYEKKENARRFSITVPLMFFGEKLIQNPIYKKFDKIFDTNVFNNGNIRTYQDILKISKDKQKQALKSKNLAYGLTFFTNTMLIAGAVAFLNRIATKKNYNRDNFKKEQNNNG